MCSYPFSEDAEDGTSYMPTRCPGWCDRIMMSHDAPDLFHTVSYQMKSAPVNGRAAVNNELLSSHLPGISETMHV